MNGLYYFTIIIAVVILFSYYLFKSKSQKSQVQKEDKDKSEQLPYSLRPSILTLAELNFYRAFTQYLNIDVVILAKARLIDIFDIKVEKKDYLKYYGRISQSHVDFIICQKNTLCPIFAIELDDKSHNSEKAKVRDSKKDKVFKAAKLDLIRVPAQYEYSKEFLNKYFTKYIQPQKTYDEKSKTSTEYPSEKVNESPIVCPKCGGEMVVRIAKHGENKGKKFYGCSNFPACRESTPAETE